MQHFITGALVALTATAAHAEYCGPRDAFLSALPGARGQQVVSAGIVVNGQLMELWASPIDGTWTFTVSPSEDVTCLVAEGGNWVSMEIEIGEPEGDPL